MSTPANPVPQWSATRWLGSILKAFLMMGLGCLSLFVAIAAAALIVTEMLSEPRDPDQCLEPYPNLERDIRAGLEYDTDLLRIMVVDAEDGPYYIGGLVTSPEIEGTQVAVWATNRVYDPHFWGPKEIGDIVPVNPAAMTVSEQHYQPWIAPEWFQSASRRIGKEPTLISMVSMEDHGARRVVECVEGDVENATRPLSFRLYTALAASPGTFRHRERSRAVGWHRPRRGKGCAARSAGMQHPMVGLPHHSGSMLFESG